MSMLHSSDGVSGRRGLVLLGVEESHMSFLFCLEFMPGVDIELYRMPS